MALRNTGRYRVMIFATVMMAVATIADAQGDTRLLDRARVLWKFHVYPGRELFCWHFWISDNQVVVHDGTTGKDVLINRAANTATASSRWSNDLRQTIDKKRSTYFDSTMAKLIQIAGLDDSYLHVPRLPNGQPQFVNKQQPRLWNYQGFQILVPGITHLRTADISAQKDQAVWMLTSIERNAGAVQLHRLYSKIQAPQKFITAVWVTHKGSSEPHELGWIERLARWSDGDDFRNIEWTPDGKSVTFIYKFTLYEVSVQ